MHADQGDAKGDVGAIANSAAEKPSARQPPTATAVQRYFHHRPKCRHLCRNGRVMFWGAPRACAGGLLWGLSVRPPALHLHSCANFHVHVRSLRDWSLSVL